MKVRECSKCDVLLWLFDLSFNLAYWRECTLLKVFNVVILDVRWLSKDTFLFSGATFETFGLGNTGLGIQCFFFSIIVAKQLPPFLTSLRPRNDSLLITTVEVTLLPYPKLSSVWKKRSWCCSNSLIILVIILGRSLLIPYSLSDARILLFNANFSACKLIID